VHRGTQQQCCVRPGNPSSGRQLAITRRVQSVRALLFSMRAAHLSLAQLLLALLDRPPLRRTLLQLRLECGPVGEALAQCTLWHPT
jgi:hypothetical protein